MADDNTEKENSEVKVSDEALSTAYRDEFGEEVGKTAEDLEKAKVKLADAQELKKKGAYTAAEGSRLGREIKELKGTVSQIQETLKTLVESRSISEKSNEEPSYVSTVDDLDKWEEQKEKKLEEADITYGKNYIAYVKELMKGDEDIDEKSQEEMWDLLSKEGSPFNVRRGNKRRPDTWNPVTDVEINYAKAKAHLFKNKATKLRPNVKGERGVSTNLSISSRTDSQSTEEVPLDDFAKDLVAKVGKDEKWASEVLKGETPIHLRGKF